MRKLLLVPAVLAALALSGCATVGGWFQGDNERAIAPTPLVDIEAGREVQRLWSVSLGGGEGLRGLRQRPAVDGGTVFAVTDDGRLLALDLETGERRFERTLSEVSDRRGWRIWQSRLPEGGLQSSVGVGEGLVVVVGRTGAIFALSSSDGSPRWEAVASAEVLAAPVIHRGLVFVRSQDGRVLALDAASGQHRWSHDVSIPPLTTRGASTLLAAVGLVIVGNDDGTVLALRAEDGNPIWEAVVAEADGRTELERLVDVDADLALGTDAVYASSVRGVTVAIRLQDGQVLWTRDNGGSSGLELTAQGVLLADQGGTLWSLDRAGGTALWRQEALLRRQLSGIALDGGLAVVGDLQGYLHWFDPASGLLRARARVQNARILATPLATPAGIVLAVTDEGRLAAFRLAD